MPAASAAPAPAPQGAQPQQPAGQPTPEQTQALLAAVQKGLVQCVQQLSQELGVPPPIILKAVQAIVAQLGSGGPQPNAPPGGVRPTQ